MNQPIASAISKPQSQIRLGSIIFLFGIAFILATVLLGYQLEPVLQKKTLQQLTQSQDPMMAMVLIFAFGFPLGVVALFAGVLIICRENLSKTITIIAIGVLLVSLAAVVPAVFGREIDAIYFGAGGWAILLSVIISFWFWAQHRSRLEASARAVSDLKALGYVCFALAAWSVCGFATMPSFALYPEKMIELGARPFAIGQLKAVMAYFVLGWIFTAAGFYKSISSK